MNVVKIEHQCGTWNLWNLFPHNILGICKYMLLNIYSELCYLGTLETWGVRLHNIKSMGKGSTGSTPTHMIGSYPTGPAEGCSRDARFGHAEYPHDLRFGTRFGSS